MENKDILPGMPFPEVPGGSDVKKAVALQYDPESDAAPVIAAAGHGVVAENIIRKAEEYDIPIVEDKKTADLLSQLSVGDAIPPALYQVVAEILVFITNTDAKAASKLNPYRR